MHFGGEDPDKSVPHHRRGSPAPPGPVPSAEEPTFRRRVVIAYDSQQLIWDAYYLLDAHNGHEQAEFGTLEEVTAWAR